MKLLEKHFEIALETPDGINRLRQLILKLAIQGKLVPQFTNVESSKKLIENINEERINLINKKLIKKQSITEFDSNLRPFKLPNNWTWTYLDNLTYILVDGSHNPPKNVGSGIPMISGQNVLNNKIKFDASRFITKKDLEKELLRNPIQKNDIFLTIVGSIGRSAVVETEVNEYGIQRSIAQIRSGLFPYYLCYFLQSPFAMDYLISNAKGTAQLGIYLNKLKVLPVPVPPIEEQKRIVEKINQLMLLCDKLEEERNRKNKLQLQINSAAINNLIKADEETSFNTAWNFIANKFDTLYTVKQNVINLKDAILILAIKGKLITKDIQDKETEIISSNKYKINEKDYPFSLPKGWKWLALNDLGSTQTGTTPATKNSEYYGDYIPFIGPGDIKNQVINYTNLSLSELGLEKARLIPKNSIMMVCIGGSIGKLAINDRDVACNQQINTITPYSDIDLKYLFAVLQSSYFQNQVLSNASGSATPIINKQKWISIPIPVPPYQIQKRISKKVDDLFKLCADLEKNIEQSSKKQVQILNAVLAEV